MVVGTGDRMVPPWNSRNLARLIEAPLLELPGGGHDLGYDAPADMAEILCRMARGEDAAALAQGFSSTSTNFR